MRRTAILASLFLFLLSLPAYAAGDKAPAPAKTILDGALKEAGASNRNVFLIFHATWCSWCKRLDAAMAHPEAREAIEKNYVVVHVDVLERGEKEQTVENPGGEELMKTLGGEKSGLPFYAVLDRSGKKLADSNVMPGNANIGYPAQPEEVAAFESILKKTAPGMTAEQRAAVTRQLGPRK